MLGLGIVEREFLPWLADIESTVPAMETVFVCDEALRAEEIPLFKRIKVRHFSELMSGSPDPIKVDVTYRDIGVIMFTSGTTGPIQGGINAPRPSLSFWLWGNGAHGFEL